MEDLFNTIRVRDRARPMELLFESAILKSLYLDKDPLITENIFPRLEIKLADRSFQDKFLKLYKANLLRERASHVEMANRCEAARSDPRFYTAQIPSVDRALSIESFQEYQEFLQDPNEGHPGIIELMSQEVQRRSGGHQGDRYVRHTYHLYEIARVLYEHYISRTSLFQRFDHPMSVKLVEAYKEININLAASDTQFSKYNLLSLTDTFRIANEKEFQIIVDDRLGLNFGINVPRLLLKTIEQTIAQGLIKNIAFHIESILEFTPSFEDLEYGALFSFDALQLPE
ncbi:hypothetical protein [Xanthomonas arboricola]|uniref:hypothetical protein n=1 Tax=Xanthomonas arboricola TaxID=56448 RepID=UPI002B2F37BA|nr:hypothetical protein X12_002183 [Xanthomonas arboricola]